MSSWQAVRATAAEEVANTNAIRAQEKEQEANNEHDEAKRRRDEIKALNDTLLQTQAQLRSTLYTAHLNLAGQAWDAGNVERVLELLEQHRRRPKEIDLRGFEWHYFNRLCHPEVLLIKPDGSPSSIAYSPDGTRLAAGLYRHDNSAMIWDGRTGKELLTLKGHTWPITHTTFSPDGKLLATASLDNTLKVWDAQTGKELLTIPGKGGPVKMIDDVDGEKAIMVQLNRGNRFASVAFSPDSKRLAGVERDRHTVVWDARTGAEITRIKGLGGSVSFSPDGKRLAGVSRALPELGLRAYSVDAVPGYGDVNLFDVQTGKPVFSIPKVGKYQKGFGYGKVIFRPDGKKLAAMGTTSVRLAEIGIRNFKSRGLLTYGPDEVHVRDAQTGKDLLILKHGDLVQSIAFSPDGQRLASASSDKTVKIWDANTGKELFTLKGHIKGVWDVAFHPNGQQLVTLGMDGTIKVWDLQPLAIAAGTRGVADISFSPDGRRVAIAVPNEDERTVDLKVRNAQTGQQLFALQGFDGFNAHVRRVVFSPDSTRLAGVVKKSPRWAPSLAKIWDAQTGHELFSIEDRRIREGAVFSPDGKTLALAVAASSAEKNQKDAHAVVALWDAQTGKELRSFKATGYRVVRPVAFSPDGKRLFGQVGFPVGGLASLAVRPAGVIVWDVPTGQELLHSKVAAPPLALSPDGKHLAAMDRNNAVKVWDAQTGDAILTMKGWRQEITGIDFSPDGQRLVAASAAVIKLWDARTGEELLTLQGQEPPASPYDSHRANPSGPVVFSPDGNRLFGLGADGMVKIWDATPLAERP